MKNKDFSITVTSFYDFFNISDLENIKDLLLKFTKGNNLRGTILIAEEGINSTISGHKGNIRSFYNFVENLFNKKFTYKESFYDDFPFGKMKVKIKNEIVTMGVANIDARNYNGEYIAPENWDEFISDPNVILVDTRNNYEVALGSFKGSLNPETDNFRQFPNWADNNLYKDKKIAMFCTGGIRCEKSTAYLKTQGFTKVYHLKGGIINYLEKTGNRSNMWEGNCFVFDDRMTINDELTAQDKTYCNSCEAEITTDDIKRLKGKIYSICSKCYIEKL